MDDGGSLVVLQTEAATRDRGCSGPPEWDERELKSVTARQSGTLENSRQRRERVAKDGQVGGPRETDGTRRREIWRLENEICQRRDDEAGQEGGHAASTCCE